MISSALVTESLEFLSVQNQSEELQAEIHMNHKLTQQCLENVASLIKAGVWAQETETSAAVIYALENLHQMQVSVNVNRLTPPC